jgi:cell division protein FtsL
MTSPASMYRIFKRAGGEALSVRSIVIAMVAIACGLVAIGLISVQRHHQVLRLGYEVSRESSHVLELRETKRKLELEVATLTSPVRIRRLATQLGMAPVSPDHVRIVKPKQLTER